MTTDSSSHQSLRIFLCHASVDKEHARELYGRLKDDGFDPWLDEENLLGGQDWRREIPKAVRDSDVVLICLSNYSIRKKGYVQKEINLALDVAEEQPEGTIYIIPVRLEDCEVPERLSGWQSVNLFEDKGYEKLIQSLKHRANTPGETLPSSESRSTPVPSASSTDEAKDWLQRLLEWPADTVFFTFNLLCRPIKTVLSRLGDGDDGRRFRQALYFLVAMVCVYSVIEIVLLYHSGIRVRRSYFLVEVGAYLFVSFIFAVILHVSLKLFRVQSDLLNKTLPCFLYYAAIVIPIYALLNYFPDFVEYKVINKAGIGILLRPSELPLLIDELLREWGKAFEWAFYICGGLVALWSLVSFGFFAGILSKLYQRRFRTFLAAFLAYLIISLIEQFGVKPVSTWFLYLLSQPRQEVTKVGTPQSGN